MAKFELNPYYRNISEEELLQDIVRVCKELNKKSVTCKEYGKDGKYGATTVLRKFGSWNSAIEKAGLCKIEQINYTEKDFFENLLNVWIKLGRQPLYREMKKPLSNINVGTYENRFSGWRNALEKFVIWANSEDKEIYFEETDNLDIFKHKTKRDINLRLRFQVLLRDNFKCCSCGASPAKNSAVELHIDHVKPWSKGGETLIENLQTLCSNCNYGKSDLT